MIIGYLRPDSTTVHFLDMEDTLENWYNLLGCSTIEIHRLNKTGDIVFICDESGLLKENPSPCLFWGEEILVGSIGFAHEADQEGNLQPLTLADVHQILKYCSTNAAWKPDISPDALDLLTENLPTEPKKKPVQRRKRKVKE